MRLPQDMKPTKLIGDSFAYREAYNNQEIYIAIAYGEVLPRRNERDRLFNACDTLPSILKDRTYHESVIDIAGRKAKFVIDDHLRPESIATNVCFPPDDKGVQLIVAAYCRHYRE